MSRAAQSVLIFGLYMLLQGTTLLLFPNFLLGFLGLGLAQDVWPRVAGLALLALAFYYIQSARANQRDFFAWTVMFRSFQLLVFVGFVLTGLGKPVLFLTSGIEFLAGLWTWLELRRSRAGLSG